MKGERKPNFLAQALLPRVGVCVLLCLASRKEFLNHWVRNNINIIIIQLSVSIWNMLWSLAVILWRRLLPDLTLLMAKHFSLISTHSPSVHAWNYARWLFSVAICPFILIFFMIISHLIMWYFLFLLPNKLS